MRARVRLMLLPAGGGSVRGVSVRRIWGGGGGGPDPHNVRALQLPSPSREGVFLRHRGLFGGSVGFAGRLRRDTAEGVGRPRGLVLPPPVGSDSGVLWPRASLKGGEEEEEGEMAFLGGEKKTHKA